MALIDDKTREFLLNKFSQDLQRPVKVELFRGKENPETVEFSINLLKELSELSDRISFDVKDLDGEAEKLGISASPTLLIGRDLGYRLEYWGAPLGMEAEGFIDTLLMASRGESGLTGASREMMKLLDKEVRAYSFVTPTCPYCPQSVTQNHRLAVEAPGKVRSICVEAQENLELAQKYKVSSVPQQLFDEDTATTTVGVQPERTYVRALLEHGGVDLATLDRTEKAAKKELLSMPDNPDRPVIVTDETFQDAVQRYPFLVVDCWAEWCGPCRMVAPVVADLAKEMQGQAVFAKLDTEDNPQTSSEYRITSIPTLLVFANGKLVDRLVGFKPKPALKKDIEKLLPTAG